MTDTKTRRPLDLDAIEANDYRPDRNGAAAFRQSDLAAKDVRALVAEVRRLRSGGQELGKTVEFMAGLIKDAFVRGADDPISALHQLGEYLSDLYEEEGGLSAEEHNRVYRALNDHSAEAKRLKAENERLRAELAQVTRGALQGGAR